MLSIRNMTLGGEDYYLNLAAEDYYLNGGEPPGFWLGEGAAALELGEVVERDQLRQLMLGLSPDGEALVQNAGKLNRQPGWDHTFSAPKSVSIIWSQASPELRSAIEQCHLKAIREAVHFLEINAAITRRGHGGSELERAKLIVACFEHGTSREQDPQLHTHVLILNAALRQDGRFGALRSLDLYEHKMAAGAVYRLALAHALRHELGLKPKAVRTWFEVAGVPDTLIQEFSKRREQIKEVMDALGLKGAAAAAFVTLDTRQKKSHVPRSQLFAAWQAVGRAFRFTQSVAESLAKPRKPLSPTAQHHHASMATRNAVDEIMQERSYFAGHDLVRGVAERLQHGRVSPEVMNDAVRKALADRDVVMLGLHDGHELYTTRSHLQLEAEILSIAARSQARTARAPSRDSVEKASLRATLDDEQRAALIHLTLDAGSIKLLTGGAGTGKTRTLKAANDAWRQAGLRPIGASLAARAARGLEDASGIKSYTVAKLLFMLDGSPGNRGKKPGSRKAGKPSALPLKPRIKLMADHVLVIDEAGMVGTRDLHRLLIHAEKAGATVALIGDHQQLPSIEAGAPFAALLAKLRHAALAKNWRQQIAWHAEATRHFADGDAPSALALYASNKRLSVHQTEQDAMNGLIESWSERRTAKLEDSLILTGTRREAKLLNLLAQAKRREHGELGRTGFLHAGTRYQVKDRVLFTQNSRRLGVDNGDTGTIVKIDHASSRSQRTVTVKLDRPKKRFGVDLPWNERVTFKLADYGDLSLGYAATTHKAQGATLDRTFVYAGGWMTDREMAYVQMSRHREDCHIFATVTSVGEDLAELARLMKKSHAKQMAHDFQRERAL